MSHLIWLFIISRTEMAILHVKLVWLLDALWRPLFLVIKSSWSLLGTSSKYDSGRLEQYMKNLRNFHKIYAFRPEVYLELFQVQIRTALYLWFGSSLRFWITRRWQSFFKIIKGAAWYHCANVTWSRQVTLRLEFPLWHRPWPYLHR